MTKASLKERQRLRRLRQQKRAYAKSNASEQFDRLVKRWMETGGPDTWKELEDFSGKGKYQKELFDKKFNNGKKPTRRRTHNRKQTKDTWLDRLAGVTSWKPYQGGSPGLGKKRK